MKKLFESLICFTSSLSSYLCNLISSWWCREVEKRQCMCSKMRDAKISYNKKSEESKNYMLLRMFDTLTQWRAIKPLFKPTQKKNQIFIIIVLLPVKVWRVGGTHRRDLRQGTQCKVASVAN